MTAKMQHPLVIKGLSLSIFVLSTIILFMRFEGIPSLILGSLLFYGLSVYVWLHSRKEIAIDENESILLIKGVFTIKFISIPNIVSLTIKWSFEPVPYCFISYQDSHKKVNQFRFPVWGYQKVALQTILLYLHKINSNIPDIDLDKYFFSK